MCVFVLRQLNGLFNVQESYVFVSNQDSFADNFADNSWDALQLFPVSILQKTTMFFKLVTQGSTCFHIFLFLESYRAAWPSGIDLASEYILCFSCQVESWHDMRLYHLISTYFIPYVLATPISFLPAAMKLLQICCHSPHRFSLPKSLFVIIQVEVMALNAITWSLSHKRSVRDWILKFCLK